MSTPTPSSSEHLKQALLALRDMRRKLEAEQHAKTEPIAIIGMGCRFPGSANTPAAFWDILRQGQDVSQEIPCDRWNLDAYYDPDPEQAGKHYVRRGYFLDTVDQFDAQFFGITPREAMTLDPQQRLLLEVCWEALENAGQAPSRLRQTQTGAYMGVMHQDYSRRITAQGHSQYLDAYYGTGNGASFLSGRLSYILGIQGPSIVLDTACSSSLVAIHLACQGLRLRDCDVALAGGVNLMLFPEAHISLSRMQALAPDGYCKTFDARANGYARGEGCGIVVLKRLSDALASDDAILGVIRGSAVNHDGPSSGLTVPNGPAQQALLRQALLNARVAPEEISYVEAHGTGTKLGDPIEVQALQSVYGSHRQTDNPLYLGSVKTNVGHLESAAGMAGLIKILLAFQHRQIPPHLHLERLNPHISLEQSAVQIPTHLTPWQASAAKPRRAGLSSFGLGGVNAHLILEEAPTRRGDRQPRPVHLVTLSAKTPTALQQQMQALQAYAQAYPEIDLGDVAASLNGGRDHFAYRWSTVGESMTAVLDTLQEELQEELQEGTADTSATQTPVPERPRLAFLFTGQGSQMVNMGRQLYETLPAFQEQVQTCDRLLRPYLEVPLLAVLYPDLFSDQIPAGVDPELLIHETAYTQPALFAIEYALAQLWLSWGIRPNAVMGHSVGEYVAACIAGVFSLEDGLKLIAHRGRLMQAMPSNGSMAATFTDEATLQPLLAPFKDRVVVATLNGPTNTVISGERESLEQILQKLEAQGIGYRALQVSHAFHSPMMEPMLAEFSQIAESITFHPPQIALISNLTGKQVEEHDICQADYWCRHIRQAVRFQDSLETLQSQDYKLFLEVGPKPILTRMGQRCLEPGTAEWLPSLAGFGEDWQDLLTSLAELYQQGAEVNWPAVDGGYGRVGLPLPNYPFQRRRFWVEETQLAWHDRTAPTPRASARPGIAGDTIGARQSSSTPSLLEPGFTSPLDGRLYFTVSLNLQRFPALADHRVHGVIVVPAAFYLSVLVAVAQQVLDRAQAITLTNLAFQQALVLSADQDATVKVQVVLSPQDNGYQAQIFSSQSSQTAGLVQDWVQHVEGTIQTAPPIPAKEFDAQAIQQRCSQHTATATALYQRVAQQRGLQLGDRFQWLGALWQGDHDAFSQIKTPTPQDTTPYPIHPGLIDSCFQLLSASLSAMADDHRASLEETAVPVALDQVQIDRLPLASDSLQAYAQRQQGALEGWIVGDMQVANTAGEVFFTLAGLKVKPIRVQGLERSPSSQAVPPTAVTKTIDPTSWLYTLNWRPDPQPATSVSTPTGRWLIFTDASGVGQELAQHWHRTRPGTCIQVEMGSTYGMTQPDVYQVNPQHPEDFVTLLQTILHSGSAPLEGIVYGWGLESRCLDRATSTQDPGLTLFEEQERLCGGLLYLVQAIGQLSWHSMPRLWIVTRQTQAVLAQETTTVSAASLWGLGRVLAWEHPDLWGGLIDLECLDTDSARDEEVRSLAQTLLSTVPDSVNAFRQGQNYTARLQPLAAHASATPVATPTAFTCNSEATYLITGGLGALGWLVAHWLIDRGARALVLVSRRGLTAEHEPQIQRWAEQGITVEVAAIDIADTTAVSDLMKTLAQGDRPLRGIIHSAGVLADGVLLKQTWAQFVRVMTPKIQGAWNLHQATLHLNLDLDFFVLFSSAASLLGSPGQGNYAAANAWMDSLAHARQAQGLPGLSLNWGPWAGGGMATDQTGAQHRWESQGVTFIKPEQGLNLLAQMLQQSQAQVGVLPMTWEQFLAPLNTVPPLLQDLAVAQPQKPSTTGMADASLQALTNLPQRQRWDRLLEQIRQAAAQVMGLTAADIGPDQGLFQMGLDSLMAVELMNRLQQLSGQALPSTLAFEYSTVRSLAEYLADQVLGWNASVQSETSAHPQGVSSPFPTLDGTTEPAPTPSDRPQPQAIVNSLTNVDELSDDDVAEILTQQLAELEVRIASYE